jgi:hypothetical protein
MKKSKSKSSSPPNTKNRNGCRGEGDGALKRKLNAIYTENSSDSAGDFAGEDLLDCSNRFTHLLVQLCAADWETRLGALEAIAALPSGRLSVTRKCVLELVVNSLEGGASGDAGEHSARIRIVRTKGEGGEKFILLFASWFCFCFCFYNALFLADGRSGWKRRKASRGAGAN